MKTASANPLRLLLSALCAGFCIGLGGAVYVAQISNKPLGAVLFCIGLYAICEFKFHLFTGKVCYATERPVNSFWEFPVIWVGNFMGTGIVAFLLRQTRLLAANQAAALALVQVKNNDTLLSLFILGMFCNVFVFLAVEGFRSIPLAIGKYLAIFVGITVFILSGYEHCVADMFYYFMAGAMDGTGFCRLLVITAGNICGGLLAYQGVALARR
jgi:formate/nitrite transporter FocA (FNT family)